MFSKFENQLKSILESSGSNFWIGVDLDGTLAEYHEWEGIENIGKPIPKMINRVKKWLKDGIEVRIVTARVAGKDGLKAKKYIENWCEEYIGQKLKVQCEKDQRMKELWDDRAIQIISNTGERVDAKD